MFEKAALNVRFLPARQMSDGVSSDEFSMIGQNGIRCKPDFAGTITPPIRYDALETCLRKTAAWAIRHDADIHAPRIGCGLAGGNWNVVEEILERTSADFCVDIYIYDLSNADQEKYLLQEKES